MLRAGLWHRGKQQVLNVESPPAGSNWNLALPQNPEGVWWRVVSVAFTLITDVTVINRFQRVVYRQGGTDGPVYAITGNPTAIVAASNITCIYGEGYTAVLGAGGPVNAAPLPTDLRARAQDAVGSAIANLQAGDTMIGIRLVVEEWVYEEPGQFAPNVGDGSNRVDVAKLNGTMERLESLLQKVAGAFEATP